MELPDLGAPCSEAACRRLDFLPLKCDACERIFCADHVSYARHRCTSAYKKIFTNKCGQAGCRQREMMPVLCEQCRRNFCLKHRHPLDHDCAGAARAPVSRAG
ncbi:AN1-type zinc finger protein 2B [Alligator mississippiensis]|uniref:AN1-type zinc finger protein 2B n=1 Tax=Alligator mississippiensis TaxID=8496 RepID=A0A151N3A8_ALLMI|nr:AN1-type zinc finger protein 2B [Alligator mississippiensis]